MGSKLEAERQAELKRIALGSRKKEKDAEEKAKRAQKKLRHWKCSGQKDDAVRSNLVAQSRVLKERSVEIDREVRKEEKAVLENKVSGIRTIWKYGVHEGLRFQKRILDGE